MNIEEFKTNGHKMVDWMYEYLRDIEKYPIKPNINQKKFMIHYLTKLL